jgi:hypothetical protein
VYFQRRRLSSVLLVIVGQTIRRIEQRWFSGHLANRGRSGMSSGFITVTLTSFFPCIIKTVVTPRNALFYNLRIFFCYLGPA